MITATVPAPGGGAALFAVGLSRSDVNKMSAGKMVHADLVIPLQIMKGLNPHDCDMVIFMAENEQELTAHVKKMLEEAVGHDIEAVPLRVNHNHEPEK